MKNVRVPGWRLGKLGLVALLTGGLLGFTLGSFGLLPVPEIRIRWTVPIFRAAEYLPSATLEAGEEVLLIYVGSSSCGWSNVPELPEIVQDLKTGLQQRVREAGKRFAAVGIAGDRHADEGLAHLEKFGAFDETIAGRSWVNSGIQRYIFGSGSLAGPGVTPQIIIVARRLGYSTGHVSVVEERALLRKAGLDEIAAWVGQGAPIPGYEDGSDNGG